MTGLGVGAYGLFPDDASIGFSTPRSEMEHAGAAIVTEVARPALVAPIPTPAYRPIPVPTRAADPGATYSAPVVVTLVPRAGEALPPPVSGSPIPKDRDTLTRELQKELKRVGCYDGEIHGAWTQSTRRAMKAFTDRVNASLPVDEPDSVLFALVKSQRDSVCGQPCPAGQGLSNEGRCLPSAILAKAARKGAPATATAGVANEKGATATSGWSTVTRAAPDPAIAAATPAAHGVANAQPPITGRMALAGPAGSEDPASAAAPAPLVAPSHRAPSAAPPPKRPAQKDTSWVRSMRARYFGSPN